MKIDRALLRESWRSWVSNDMRQPVGPWWLQALWTALFCAALAVLFTLVGFMAFARGEGSGRSLAGWALWYGRNLVVCLSVGTMVHLLFAGLRRHVPAVRRVARWRPWQRTLFFTTVPMAGVAVGWPVGVALAGADIVLWIGSREGRNLVAGTLLLSLGISFLLHHFFAAKTRQVEAERSATEARLRLLQGQIEPHFLFNTLANVAALIDTDAPKARAMLEAFTDYLRTSLGALRGGHSTLAQEIGLAQAYLSVLQSRMEDRLQFAVEHDPALAAARLPALVLQPLVENAVHHGLEPKVEGGHVLVRARSEGATLVLQVADDGVGLAAAAARRRKGHGLALANLRERLAALYGSEASLTVAESSPGTLATLRLPLETPA